MMNDTQARAAYTATIGIECHVQLKTATKLFSGANNDARQAAPNTLVNHIDFGLPGALPVLNSQAVRLAAIAGFALGSAPQPFSKFDRKHYFYPDLPLGYQITQFDQPIVLGGSIDITVPAETGQVATTKTIGITRAHLEADAGKSTHPAGGDRSLVDLNRAGTPLLEIVSEPDMHTAAEAKAYAHELYLRMKYAGVSDANLFYGNMRFDVNVSVSKTDELGTRTETKNINSFKAVEKTVDYEIARQIAVLEDGGTIVQETRGWDDSTQSTFSQRTKEDAHDYRYFPDPDLPPIVLSDDYIQTVRDAMPRLPDDYRREFAGIGIDGRAIEDVISSMESALLVQRILDKAGAEHARRVAFWFMQVFAEVSKQSTTADNAEEPSAATLQDDQLITLSKLVGDNKLSSTGGKEVLKVLLVSGGDPAQIAQDMNLLQESDESAILAIVDRVLADNTKAAEDVRSGEMKAIGFLVGQVMKQSAGKANPAVAQQLIKRQLGL